MAEHYHSRGQNGSHSHLGDPDNLPLTDSMKQAQKTTGLGLGAARAPSASPLIPLLVHREASDDEQDSLSDTYEEDEVLQEVDEPGRDEDSRRAAHETEIIEHQVRRTRHYFQPNVNLDSEKSTDDLSKAPTDEEAQDERSWHSGSTEPDRLGSTSSVHQETQTLRHRRIQTVANADTQTSSNRRRKLPNVPSASYSSSDSTSALEHQRRSKRPPSRVHKPPRKQAKEMRSPTPPGSKPVQRETYKKRDGLRQTHPLPPEYIEQYKRHLLDNYRSSASSMPQYEKEPLYDIPVIQSTYLDEPVSHSPENYRYDDEYDDDDDDKHVPRHVPRYPAPRTGYREPQPTRRSGTHMHEVNGRRLASPGYLEERYTPSPEPIKGKSRQAPPGTRDPRYPETYQAIHQEEDVYDQPRRDYAYYDQAHGNRRHPSGSPNQYRRPQAVDNSGREYYRKERPQSPYQSQSQTYFTQTPSEGGTQTPVILPRFSVVDGDGYMTPAEAADHLIAPWAALSPYHLEESAKKDFSTQTFGQLLSMSHNNVHTQTSKGDLEMLYTEHPTQTDAGPEEQPLNRQSESDDIFKPPKTRLSHKKSSEKENKRHRKKSAKAAEHSKGQNRKDVLKFMLHEVKTLRKQLDPDGQLADEVLAESRGKSSDKYWSRLELLDRPVRQRPHSVESYHEDDERSLSRYRSRGRNESHYRDEGSYHKMSQDQFPRRAFTPSPSRTVERQSRLRQRYPRIPPQPLPPTVFANNLRHTYMVPPVAPAPVQYAPQYVPLPQATTSMPFVQLQQTAYQPPVAPAAVPAAVGFNHVPQVRFDPSLPYDDGTQWTSKMVTYPDRKTLEDDTEEEIRKSNMRSRDYQDKENQRRRGNKSRSKSRDKDRINQSLMKANKAAAEMKAITQTLQRHSSR